MSTSLIAPTNAGPASLARAERLDRALQFGPAMRVQRMVEAAFLLVAIATQDVRLAYVTLLLTALQVLSPRWVPVAQAVARIVPFRGEHRIGDLYFDLGGMRGASAISVLVQVAGIGMIWSGLDLAGFVLLTLPTASFLMAPTLGFCCGCWFYVLGRDWVARRGWLKEGFDDGGDIAIAPQGERDPLDEADHHHGRDQPELPT